MWRCRRSRTPNDGTRVAGLPGHDESAEYVAEQAEAAGLDVSFQEFTYEYALGDIGVPVLDVVGGKRYEPGLFGAFSGGDFGSQAFSPSGDVPAPLWAADLKLPSTGGSTSGCEAADYTGMPAGAVVLVQRGTCALVNKWRVAQAAIYEGAAGVAFDP